MILKIRSTLEASLEKWTLSSLIHLKRTGLNLWILIRKTTNSELLLGFLSPLLEVKGRKPSLFFTLSSRRASPTTMSFFIHPAEMLCLWRAGCGSSTVPGTGHSPGKWASGLQWGWQRAVSQRTRLITVTVLSDPLKNIHWIYFWSFFSGKHLSTQLFAVSGFLSHTSVKEILLHVLDSLLPKKSLLILVYQKTKPAMD